MMTHRLAPFLALGLLLACDEGIPEESTDTGTDAVEDTGDAGDDTAPDTVDTTPDTVEDTADEVIEDTDEETTEVGDTVDEEVDVPDTGTDCSDDGTVCEDPYTCIEGVCRVTIANTTWAEEDFSIVEPEELSAIFDTFKSFASDIKFMVLDVEDGTTELSARVGAADVVNADAEPVQVSYQEGISIGDLTFRPHTDDEAPLDGRAWVTDEFFYELRATATIEFPTIDPIAASFGLDANDVTIVVTQFAGGDADSTDAHIVGYVTREETEFRSMMAEDELPAFAALFCLDDPGHDPEGIWNLSDVLDCNGAEMDVDSNGDDIMDSYRVVIDARISAATLIE